MRTLLKPLNVRVVCAVVRWWSTISNGAPGPATCGARTTHRTVSHGALAVGWHSTGHARELLHSQKHVRPARRKQATLCGEGGSGGACTHGHTDTRALTHLGLGFGQNLCWNLHGTDRCRVAPRQRCATKRRSCGALSHETGGGAVAMRRASHPHGHTCIRRVRVGVCVRWGRQQTFCHEYPPSRQPCASSSVLSHDKSHGTAARSAAHRSTSHAWYTPAVLCLATAPQHGQRA